MNQVKICTDHFLFVGVFGMLACQSALTDVFPPVWTTVNTWGMETSCQPGYRRSRTPSTSSVTPKPAATRRTTWASSPWRSKSSSVPDALRSALWQWRDGVQVCSHWNLFTCHSNCEVLTTLTPDTGRILSKLHAVQPKGNICFCTGIRVAHVGSNRRKSLSLLEKEV